MFVFSILIIQKYLNREIRFTIEVEVELEVEVEVEEVELELVVIIVTFFEMKQRFYCFLL